MAIAPLLDTDGLDWSAETFDARPRPALRLVPVREAAPTVGPGRLDGVRRRARRAVVRRRRRAVVFAAAVAGLVCGLALPIASLGGSPVAAHPRVGAATAGETVYVVRPGDTLWSIAARFDRGGNPRPMAEALAREIGSDVVTPGERIPIP